MIPGCRKLSALWRRSDWRQSRLRQLGLKVGKRSTGVLVARCSLLGRLRVVDERIRSAAGPAVPPYLEES